MRRIWKRLALAGRHAARGRTAALAGRVAAPARRVPLAAASVAVAALLAAPSAATLTAFPGLPDGGAAAQERGRRFAPPPRFDVTPEGRVDASELNVPYDGRFIFARLMFAPLGGPRGGFGRVDLKWDHDYPRAERNFTRILDEVTTIVPYLEGGNILAMDDPELFKYPIAYVSEPGFWTMTEAEEESLRTYLLKGGFLIFDDFVDAQWFNFARMMDRLLPDHRLVRLEADHPIFDAFFHIESLVFDHPNFPYQAEFYGVFEDNDPEARLMAIVNYNNDIGDYWEWSDAGFVPIELSNEAYKLGVNYIVYAMTH